MLKIDPETGRRPLSHVLCLGAHCDDIEIGCGGTLLKLLEERAALRVDWVVFSSDERRRADEARESAREFLARAGESNVLVEDFRGRYFPYVAEIKEYFDALGARLSPDLIFTHHSADLHQDHRVISELTLNTFRDHLILEYEVPKYDGDMGRPNVFVHLEPSHCEQKVDTILRVFESQQDKHWFTRDTFLGLLSLRGVESKAPSGYAEAFYGKKIVLA